VGERKTHAEAEGGDERKGATMPNGNRRDVEGPVFGADHWFSDRSHISVAEDKVGGLGRDL
jgi:hypothetical protein